MNELIPVEEALERATKLNVFTPTGLDLPDELTEVDVLCIATQLGVTDSAVGWGRADLMLYIKKQYPYAYKEMWCNLFPEHSYGTLYNDMRTAIQYTTQERYRWCIEDGLSYGHCQKAGHLPDEQREDALTMARDNGWNVRQLEAYVIHGQLLPTAQQSSRDRLYGQCDEWLSTLDDERDADLIQNAYVIYKFLDWLEE